MDLFGWDLVCACTLPKLNQLLAAQFAQTPAAIDFKDDSGTSFTAQFDPRATHLDDATKKTQFLLPIHTGSLMLNGGPNSVDLSGVTLLVQLDLAFVSNVASASDLQFNLQMKGADENDTTPGAVFVVNPDTSGVLKTRDSSGQVAQTLHNLLPLCLIQNKTKLAYVLNRLNLTPTQGACTAGGTVRLSQRHFVRIVFAHRLQPGLTLHVLRQLTIRTGSDQGEE